MSKSTFFSILCFCTSACACLIIPALHESPFAQCLAIGIAIAAGYTIAAFQYNT